MKAISIQGNPFSTPFVIGHRGAKALAPENTLPSVRRAASEGAKWVEFDVKLSADNVPVILHDETVNRTTDGQGFVAQMPLETLLELDAGSWFDPGCSGTRIPTLIDMIRLLEDLNLGANVELKPCPGRGQETAAIVCQILQEHWPEVLPGPVLSSFDSHCLFMAHAVTPTIECAMLWDVLPEDWRRSVDELGARGVHLSNRKLQRRHVDAVLSAGLSLRVFTVNDTARAEVLRGWGVTSIFTDVPDQIKD